MKRLFKDREKRKICGVCAGVAEYLGIDPTIVRIIWAIVGLCYGTGVLIYLVCALVLPDKAEIQ